MFREFVAATGLGGLHLVAMVILFVCFVAVAGHALFSRDAKRRGERAARLPLNDGEPVAPRTGERREGR